MTSQAGKRGQELVTAPLDGTILPGVTRDSILELTRSWGEFDVSERPISIREVKQVRPNSSSPGMRVTAALQLLRAVLQCNPGRAMQCHGLFWLFAGGAGGAAA